MAPAATEASPRSLAGHALVPTPLSSAEHAQGTTWVFDQQLWHSFCDWPWELASPAFPTASADRAVDTALFEKSAAASSNGQAHDESRSQLRDLQVAAKTMKVEPEALSVTRRPDGTLQVSLRTA